MIILTNCQVTLWWRFIVFRDCWLIERQSYSSKQYLCVMDNHISRHFDRDTTASHRLGSLEGQHARWIITYSMPQPRHQKPATKHPSHRCMWTNTVLRVEPKRSGDHEKSWDLRFFMALLPRRWWCTSNPQNSTMSRSLTSTRENKFHQTLSLWVSI